MRGLQSPFFIEKIFHDNVTNIFLFIFQLSVKCLKFVVSLSINQASKQNPKLARKPIKIRRMG